MKVTVAIVLGVLAAIVAAPETLTLPLSERPDWLTREGIVMAGSWEPLLFRVRRDGSPGYTPSPEQRAAYAREHSTEMIERLKSLGVNFVMTHCYKGAGLEAERQGMEDAADFARRCHEAGLHVGVYVYSGAFLWEPFFQEKPEARNWVLLDETGKPRQYGSAAYRYYWDRNHPDAQAFYRGIVQFAVDSIQTDLVHFDNYSFGPGSDANSVQRFGQYLAQTFSEEEVAAMAPVDVEVVKSLMTGSDGDLMRRAWLDFQAQSLTDSYTDMGRYARSLRKDVLLECNPGGPGTRIRPPIDHGRLLEGGEAYWDEGRAPGLEKGRLNTRIRTYKIARRLNNMAFLYTTSPLEMAEAMAFNQDCLGCVCWFEYGTIVNRPGSSDPMADDTAPCIRFFNERRDLLRGADVVADIAVLRNYPSQVFADPQYSQLTAQVEQALIEQPTCFQIVYDQQLEDLEAYKILVLAGCLALSNAQVNAIQKYVERGGRLAVVGPLGTHDEWMRPRGEPALGDLPQERVLHCSDPSQMLQALTERWPDSRTLIVDGPLGLCSEVTKQPGRLLIHLVNYRENDPARNVRVRLRVPHTVGQVTLASPGHEDTPLRFDEAGGAVSFVVPEVDVYEIAVIAMQK